MYEKILLACDPEGLAEAAAPVVAGLATEHRSDVRVVAVQDPGADPAARAVTEGWLDRVVRELQAHGVAGRPELRQAGRRAVVDELAEAAHAFGADLIVLGTHHRGELSGLAVASVGHALAARVDTPIMFVSAQRGAATSDSSEAAHLWAKPPREVDLRRVLLAIDRTEGSQVAVHAVAGLASPGAEALAVHVRGPEPEDEARALLRDAVRVLEQAGMTARSELLGGDGPVAASIADAAERWDAGLIVMGSRRLTDLGGLLMGSVAHGVVRRSQRPVLLAERQAAGESR